MFTYITILIFFLNASHGRLKTSSKVVNKTTKQLGQVSSITLYEYIY